MASLSSHLLRIATPSTQTNAESQLNAQSSSRSPAYNWLSLGRRKSSTPTPSNHQHPTPHQQEGLRCNFRPVRCSLMNHRGLVSKSLKKRFNKLESKKELSPDSVLGSTLQAAVLPLCSVPWHNIFNVNMTQPDDRCNFSSMPS